MASSKLLKEAIADAKAVRETALANAKIQLEEAFTPRLKSMLSQKLRAEAEDKASDEDEMKEAYGDDDEKEAEDKMEEDYNSSNIGAGKGGTNSGQNNKKPTEHNAGAEDELGAADVTSTSKKPEAEVEDYTFEKSITEENDEEEELATEGDEYGNDDEQKMESDMDNMDGGNYGADDQQKEDDLDLEAIIKELEDELHGGSDDMESEDDYNAMGRDNHDDVQEDADDVDTYMQADKPEASLKQNESDDKDDDDDDDDDDMNIEEIIKELEDEEKAEEKEKEKVEESKRLKKELAEAISVIKSLKSTINEVNLLNAKLLFSNKLFRSYNLTNEQKSKVIDSLDRTNTVREVKLVYSTLAESMKFATNSPKKSSKPMAEGASRVQTSTKPTAQKSIVSEGTTYANRFKELAGILK
jgi:hypothetical protein